MKDIFVVVPTLDPDKKIMKDFIDKLHKEFTNILVVNDGCNKSYNSFFNSLENEGIIVLKHYKNLGKGRGLKTAFNYILNNYPKCTGCVSADSDGQHSISDIKKCAESLIKNPNKMILGVRDFDNDNVPARSKFGNKITRGVFKLFIGLDITDTQTGLRGFSRELMTKLLDCKGERYEYETEMLIRCKIDNIPLKEEVIETIYIDSNAGSHFNPIKDSIKIYSLFSKYIIRALLSYIIDIVLFGVFLGIIKINSKILAATILARIISSIYVYCTNKNVKFKNVNSGILMNYYILVLGQMLLSGCFVAYLYNLLNINIYIIKVVVDIVIWLVNIFIQKEFIFIGGKK